LRCINCGQPYGVMSSEESSEDRLAQFLTSDRSRRRSAVVDLTDSFSTSVSLPLNMKCLSTSDGESSTGKKLSCEFINCANSLNIYF